MLSGAPHALAQHTCALCAHQFTEKGDAAFRLSGIVSIMFCGMVMAKYVRPNLSRSTDDRVGAFFRVIASLAEIFVFVYIGCALFTEQQAWDKPSTWMFILWSLVALAVSRYLNVYPSTAFINMLRPHEQHIPDNHKHMLWSQDCAARWPSPLPCLPTASSRPKPLKWCSPPLSLWCGAHLSCCSLAQ